MIIGPKTPRIPNPNYVDIMTFYQKDKFATAIADAMKCFPEKFKNIN